MNGKHRRAVGFTVVVVLALGLVVGVGSAGAQIFRGITFQKGCQDPTSVGAPLECAFQITNADDTSNSETFFSLEDTVFASGGNVTTSGLLPTLRLIFTPNDPLNPDTPSCVGGAGAGTLLSPYVGATSCTLPNNGSRITTLPFTHYSVVAADYNINPNHRLNDTGTLGWRNNCEDPESCSTINASAPTSASTLIAPAPAIDIEKATNGDDADSPTGPFILVGGLVTWTYVVTNTGDVTLSNVTVGDSVIGPITCPATTLAVGASMTCTATGTAAAGQYVNNSTATGHFSDLTVTDSDPSHYFGAAPALALIKRTNGTDDVCPTVAAGSTVTWTYEVTNTGNVTLTNVVVVDDNGTPGNTADDVTVGTIASLAPGATTTLTRTGAAALGAYSNVATATSTFTATGGAQLTVSAVEDDCYFAASPAINIVKSTNGQDANSPTGPVVAVGSTITWTYVVTNTGNVPLASVSVTDDRIGAITCPATTLAVGASMTCTATGIAQAGQYANVGTTTGIGAGQTVTDTDPSHYFGAAPSLNLVKKTNGTDNQCPTGPTVPVGSTVTWTYEVTNTGNVTLTNILVRDDNGTPGNTADDVTVGTIASLAPGATTTLTRTGTATAGQYTNIATASTTFTSGSLSIPVSDTDNDCFFGANPRIDIEKATNGADADTPTGPIVPVGSTITWTYVVTNTGNVPLANVSVTDDKLGAITCPATSLAVGASMTCTATGTAQAGQYANLGTTTGTGAGQTVTDTDPSHYFGQAGVPCPTIKIVKFTNGQDANWPTGPIVAVGSTVTWTYVVTNTGNVPLANVTVTDNNGTLYNTADDFNATFVGGDTNGNGILDLTETWTFRATGIAKAGQYKNIGKARGTGGGLTDTDTDPSHYLGAAPSLQLVKKTNGTDNHCPTGPHVSAGSTVTWKYQVKNTGNVPLTNIVVRDDNGTPGNTADDVAVGTIAGPLAPGSTSTLTRTGTAAAGQYINIATASTTYTNGAISIPQSDTDNDCYFGDPPKGQGDPPKGQTVSTYVSCEGFSGTAPTLGQVSYPVWSGKIAQGISPSLFFFYSRITTTVPNQVVTVTQTNNSTNSAALFSVYQGQARLYTGDCSFLKSGTVIGTRSSGATFTVPTPGTWVLSIKYSPNSTVGTNAPVPSTITYTFATSLGGTSGASLLLVKKT